MHRDSTSVQHLPTAASVAERVRLKGQKIIYYALTGYWCSGERVHPLFVTDNFVNHLRVYQFVSQFVADRNILDVGCGVGYGTALLSRTASRAVGIDNSLLAIKEAYRLHPEAEFLHMDAENMAFPDESYEVIVSTENFEHLPHQAQHVAELARVVSRDGFCFIATPNPELFVGTKNPFHIKENTYSELKKLLSSGFREVEIIEPITIPTHVEGRQAREDRFARGDHGKLVDLDLKIFAKPVNQNFLSNTHSFNCFVRDPIK